MEKSDFIADVEANEENPCFMKSDKNSILWSAIV